MFCRSLPFALALIVSSALINCAIAAEAKGSYRVVPLLSTSTNVVGETIHYPPGAAHISAAIITLAPGARTFLHKHGVPLFAYILKGTLTVNYGKHGIRTYQQGQAFMEAMTVAHYGTNRRKEPVQILAVYMDAKGAKNVVPIK